MKIIVGLGNPGEKYDSTRHNVGFFYLDKLREKFGLSAYESNKKFQAEISKGKIDETEIILVRPQTFMNLSGESVRAVLDFYKLSPDDIIVIHDDLDIGLGKYRLATDSSSAGHNGVQNIIDKLGTQKFRRVRIGIGQEVDGAPVCRLSAHPPRVDKASLRVEAGDFVLGKFTSEELETLQSISEKILEEISKLIKS